MLTVDQINAHLDRITYKPGWSFQAYMGKWEGMHLTIFTEVDDAFRPGEKVRLRVESFLGPNDYINTRMLEKWLMWRLARIEVHEMREFFKRDGKVIDSPHAEFADRDL